MIIYRTAHELCVIFKARSIIPYVPYIPFLYAIRFIFLLLQCPLVSGKLCKLPPLITIPDLIKHNCRAKTLRSFLNNFTNSKKFHLTKHMKYAKTDQVAFEKYESCTKHIWGQQDFWLSRLDLLFGNAPMHLFPLGRSFSQTNYLEIFQEYL